MDKEYAKQLIDKTKNDYNLIAEDFSRTRSRIWPEVAFLFDDLKPNEKVLDLGCGNGRYHNLIKEKGSEYIGVDNSEKLVEIARKKYPETSFLKIDSLNLPFDKNSFDKIYSIAVLHHIPSKEFRSIFLKEARRILKPNGQIIVTVWKLQNGLSSIFKYAFLKLVGKSKLDFGDVFEPWSDKTERYYHLFSKRELIRLFKKSGFKIKEVGVIEKRKRKNIYLIAQK